MSSLYLRSVFLTQHFFSFSSHVSVDSNETLYGGDPKFLSELNKLCETLIGQVLDHLKTLGRDEVGTERKKQYFCFCCPFLFSHDSLRLIFLIAPSCLSFMSAGFLSLDDCPFTSCYYAAFMYRWKSPTSHFDSSQQHYIDIVLARLQQSTRRQGALAFSLFGVLLAHGDLRNNKLSQLAVNLWNLSHKHGYCDTRTSVSLHPRIYFLYLVQIAVSLCQPPHNASDK